jgi:hypothetical protein
MAMQTALKRTAAAAGANTDTTIFTPASGLRYKILSFYVTNEGAAQAAGMNFELRYGSNIIAIVGLNSAAAPIGQTSQVSVIAHEIIGDGVTAVVVRNLTALAASSNAAAVIAYDSNYLP